MHKVNTQQKYRDSRTRQRGVVLILVTVGMLAILVMGGLALDVSHALLNKSRLQNTVDAAALTAAKALDQTSNTALARDAAIALFTSNRDTAGNGEMAADIDVSSEVVVEFSATLEPFTNGSSPARYVRVRVENFTLGSWLIQLMGIDEKIVRASAVAGPRTSPCDLTPLIVCADPDAGGPLWGFEREQVTVLKLSSQSGSQAGPIGPGNFQLASINGRGGATLREDLAGEEGLCPTDNMVTTQPGNAVGPVAQGLNTRLGIYDGPMHSAQNEYPPDAFVDQQDDDDPRTNDRMTYDAGTNTVRFRGQVVSDTNDLDFNYADYDALAQAGNYTGPGVLRRRILSIPIADCSGSNSGRTELPILTYGCFFLLQEVAQQGSEAEVFGEFVETCRGAGNPGPVPENLDGPTTIQLYKDVDSIDS